MQFQFSGPPQKRGFGCACVLCLPRTQRFRQPEAWAPSRRVRRAFSLRGERPRQPEGWAHSPRVRPTFSLRGPSARCLWLAFVQRSWPLARPSRRRMSTIQNLRKYLNRNRRPVCSVGGGGFSGAEFAPFPSPLPPTSSRDEPALLWSFSVPLFCEPTAVCLGRLILPSLSHS